MEILTITEEQLRELDIYPVDSRVSNKESQLFYFHQGNKEYLFKYFGDFDKEILANKIFTLRMLERYALEAELEEFVLPESLVSIDNSIVGFLLPIKENSTPLGILLHGSELTKREKIELVKQVGVLIEKTRTLEKKGISFYFNDLHENNFLIDNKTRKLSVIDLDGSTFRSDIALPSYYLINNPNLTTVSKYSFNVFGIPYPSHDNDLLCYNMMLLNVFADVNMNLVSVDEYDGYLDYLQKIGLSKNLVDSFRTVYTEEPNVNASLFLDNVSDDILEISSFNHMKSNLKRR